MARFKMQLRIEKLELLVEGSRADGPEVAQVVGLRLQA